MSIIGLTDRPVLRRDGKIRAGKKDGAKLVNTEHFLLHDAPELNGVLGETATEIFFTVHSDNPLDFMKSDLRWYSASQLLCMSMHNAPGDKGEDMGSVAAYFGTGQDLPGLRQQQFPRIQKARTRVCNYKSCPEYVQGKCTEHMFLDVLVPQCSMGAIFTLDSTSINAILNAHSTFTKAWTRYGGKLSGQIFRMYKKPGEIQYQKQDGSTGKRDAPMVYFDMATEVMAKHFNNPGPVIEAFKSAAHQAIQSGAEVIIPGCGCLNLVLAENKFAEVEGATVLDVTGALMKMAELMIVLHKVGGIRVSRKGYYEGPGEKVREIRAVYGLK